MMSRYFSVTTPQQAPTPRASWHSWKLGAKTALISAQLISCGTHQTARAIRTSVARVLGRLPNRLRLSQGSAPSVRTGASRGAMGSNARRPSSVTGGWSGKKESDVDIYRSLIAARLLYQFISAEVPSEVVRYTSMMIEMHSTARPVWLMRRVGDRDHIRVADRHRERRVLRQVQVLVRHRRDDHAQRLRQRHEPHLLALATGRARSPPRPGRAAPTRCRRAPLRP